MSVLDQIIEGVRADLAERERVTSLDDLRRLVDAAPPALDPMPALAAPGVTFRDVAVDTNVGGTASGSAR